MVKKNKNKLSSDATITVVDNFFFTSQNSGFLQLIMSNPYFILLIITTLMGAYLRLHSLGSESLWLDEAVTYFIGSSHSFSEVWAGAMKDRHPPLHFIIIHLVSLFSSTEFALRFPSAIFGILTIPATYLLADSLFGKKEAIISAFILAISTTHVYYSQEARMYAQMVLFSVMSIYFIYNAYKSNSHFMWGGFAISSALAFYSFYYTVFLVIPLVIFYCIVQFKDSFREKKIVVMDSSNLRNFIASMFGMMLLISPLIIPFVSQSISRTASSPTWGVGQSLSLFSTVLKQFSVSGIGFYLLFIFFIVGVISLLLNKKAWQGSLLIFLVFSIPFIASYILSASMPFSPRHALFILPVYILIISKGLVQIGDLFFLTKTSSKNSSKKSSDNSPVSYAVYILVFVLLLSALSVSSFSSYYSTNQKNDWRSAASYLEENSNTNDIIVFLPSYMRNPFNFYYDSNDQILEGASDSQDLIDINSKYGTNKIWYVVTWDIAAVNPKGDAVDWLSKNTIAVNQITGIYIFTNASN
jgi:uncharacterized membrane protein